MSKVVCSAINQYVLLIDVNDREQINETEKIPCDSNAIAIYLFIHSNDGNRAHFHVAINLLSHLLIFVT